MEKNYSLGRLYFDFLYLFLLGCLFGASSTGNVHFAAIIRLSDLTHGGVSRNIQVSTDDGLVWHDLGGSVCVWSDLVDMVI